MMKNNSHILLIDKPSDVTSFRSLGAIKHTVDKKVGHTGTLDKFAHGLMIVLTGSMTKLNILFSGMDKRYTAIIRFGEETETLDPEGEVVGSAPIPSLERIEKEIKEKFVGEILQAPPIYSAIHVNGKRAYQIARSGLKIEMKKRPIKIYDFEIIDFDGRDLSCSIKVSKGTYIRSIARDLALECESRGHLVSLERTEVGPFKVEDSVKADDEDGLKDMCSKTDELILMLDNVSIYEIGDDKLFYLANGRSPDVKELKAIKKVDDASYAAIYSADKVLRVVVSITRDGEVGGIISQVHPCFDRIKSDI
jgi:tRNA pseudouridine55 synthase